MGVVWGEGYSMQVRAYEKLLGWKFCGDSQLNDRGG